MPKNKNGTGSDKKDFRNGECSTNNQGCRMQIVKYNFSNNIIVKFIDHECLVRSDYRAFKTGGIKNPMYPSIHGVACIGDGSFTSKSNATSYRVWANMLNRCYSEKHQKRYPSYIGCTVCEEWHNFQNFAKWYEDNYYEIEGERMHLDKDILVKGNKVYSPDTCVFVPNKINSIFRRKRNNDTLPSGVSKRKGGNKYKAMISINNERKFLGYYDTPEEASFYYNIENKKRIFDIANQYIDLIPQRLYDGLLNHCDLKEE